MREQRAERVNKIDKEKNSTREWKFLKQRHEVDRIGRKFPEEKQGIVGMGRIPDRETKKDRRTGLLHYFRTLLLKKSLLQTLLIVNM